MNKTFYELYKSNEKTLDDIYYYVDEFQNNNYDCQLYEFLGVAEDQLINFIENHILE